MKFYLDLVLHQLFCWKGGRHHDIVGKMTGYYTVLEEVKVYMQYSSNH